MNDHGTIYFIQLSQGKTFVLFCVTTTNRKYNHFIQDAYNGNTEYPCQTCF